MIRDAEFFGVCFIRANEVCEPCKHFFATPVDAEQYASVLRERCDVEVRVFRLTAHLSELSKPVQLSAPIQKEIFNNEPLLTHGS